MQSMQPQAFTPIRILSASSSAIALSLAGTAPMCEAACKLDFSPTHTHTGPLATQRSLRFVAPFDNNNTYGDRR